MKAVILAAGEGFRMYPITLTRPKSMIPLVGKPILEHLINTLGEAGISEVFIVVGYKSELIEDYFGDGSRLGLSITYIYQTKRLGTTNAISLTEEYLKNESFLAVYGDLLVDTTVIKSLLQVYKKSSSTTMAVVSVSNPQHYGIVCLKEGLVVDIFEKPEPGTVFSNLANAGVYVFETGFFDEVKMTHQSLRGELEITDTILLLVKKGVRIVPTIISPKNWMDMGRPWNILEANKHILESKRLEINGEVEHGAHIVMPIGLGRGAKIRSGAYIEGPVFIDEGSDIGPNCYIRPFTSIGKRVRIGNACEIKNSAIFDGTHIGHLSYIGDSIIGEDCNLGAGTITGNLRLNGKGVKMMVKSQLVDTGLRKLGAVIGDKVETGINVNFMPGIKVGSKAWIGPSTTVYRDIPQNIFVLNKQELEYRKKFRSTEKK